jgi:hypothetical protein
MRDTEIRKLDQLRAVDVNQQRHIRYEIRDLPHQIAETKRRLADIEGPIGAQKHPRHGGLHYDCRQSRILGQGAREDAAKALTFTILSWRDDQTMQPRGHFRGFEILSKGKSGPDWVFPVTGKALTRNTPATSFERCFGAGRG